MRGQDSVWRSDGERDRWRSTVAAAGPLAIDIGASDAEAFAAARGAYDWPHVDPAGLSLARSIVTRYSDEIVRLAHRLVRDGALSIPERGS